MHFLVVIYLSNSRETACIFMILLEFLFARNLHRYWRIGSKANGYGRPVRGLDLLFGLSLFLDIFPSFSNGQEFELLSLNWLFYRLNLFFILTNSIIASLRKVDIVKGMS